jgi:peptide/nickel transport system substrate-binding protein
VSELQRRVGAIRRRRSEIENHIIDEYVAGRIDRKEFFRRGTTIGMSVPLVAFLAAACGSSSSSSSAPAATTGGGGTSAAAGGGGGTIRLGITTPTGAVNPLTIFDQGGLCVIGQVGEFLCYEVNGKLNPGLAESWTPSSDLKTWTFKIRSGVTFHDGTPMTAKDVAATLNCNADKNNGGNALSAFNGALAGGGTTASDDTTVVCQLSVPIANFPYYVCNTNYNLIIVPAAAATKDGMAAWEKTMIGTGPLKMVSYTPKQGAKFARYDGYWGTKALPDTVDVTFGPDEQPLVLALQGGQLDVVDQVSVAGSPQLVADTANFKLIEIKASTHRQLSMRCDTPPFDKKEVRQAIALCLNRPDIITGLFQGKASLGNDSPFAPVFASTNTTVPQRAQDLAKAKQLLATAGHPNGFKTTLNANKTLEIPQYAQLVADAASKIGVTIDLKVQDTSTYYGDAVFGKSPWLDSVMSLVDYGHRGVPDVFLQAPLESDGTWNAAHYKNPQYDTLAKQFIATADVSTQQQIAGQIEQMLLDDTPIIFAYFYDYLSATSSKVNGARASAMGQVWVDQATVST